ncbi:uncharacterized protein LOC132030814 [Lycium ferocissimum]|uniref:uncharacterized protein LOC132030814 n=1 Tax=Lycium ferocissimum TaxID=112874 RepID=UPI0028149A87|nr:uncharacterized protein LOC132030814 [Lycium ferocissimum]
MAASAQRSTGPVVRSLSPGGRFYSTTSRKTSSFGTSVSASSSIRFPLDRTETTSQNRSFSVTNRQKTEKKTTCMCSPTNHPGSFRCSIHKKMDHVRTRSSSTTSHQTASNSIRLHMRRSAMTNSLVRIGTVEGELVKRALAALIRPSSHQQRRRADFQPRPSRLSVIS